MKLVMIGQGGHSKVIEDIILAVKGIEIIGYFDDQYDHSYVYKGIHYGPILSAKNRLNGFEELKFMIAIGDNGVRKRIVEKLNFPDSYYAVLIHPSAVISTRTKVGYGSVIMANSVVNADANIGEHTIINTGSIVEHDTKVGDYAHISPKATLTGNVTIEEGVHIGAGATIIPQVSVGQWSTIGAGATVTRNIPSHCTAVGTPAKVKVLGGGTIAQ